MTDFTPEQQRAIDRRDGPLLVSAGAGTGKTSVLVERFARAVLDDGVAVDAILAITFTEKAAAQLTARVRARLIDAGAEVEARRAEAAWISTIHGFCARLLRTHALAAGIDPEFRVLDALEAERLAIDAFDRALGDFLGAGGEEERLRLLATYTPDRLADMVRTAYAHLRSRGEERPELPEVGPPRAAGECQTLAAAALAALAEIGAAEGKAVTAGRTALERCTALLGRLEQGGVAEPADVDRLELKGNAKALSGSACEDYRAAWQAYRDLCLRHREYLDHVLLRELLRLYGGHYAGLKRERSGLDFDDLELLARDLLARDPGLREQYRVRFDHVMVDELQDVNPLQDEILELLDRDNLFRVGDERQSIYRFRHADVGVFRAHRQAAVAAGRAERIGVNFRSRGELVDAIDLTFGTIWGEEFEPLRERPDARSEAPRVAPCVELLVADRSKRRWDERFAEELERGEEPFGPAMTGVTPWRAAEARLLARRVEELARAGPYRYGDVVLLLRATTHIGIYERALEERGIPTHVLGGRGYWSQQQVGDLRAHLAALANPLDELALHSVLASPLCGVALDSLVLIAGCARRLGGGWDVWRVLEAVAGGRDGAEPVAEIARLVADLPPGDHDRLVGFAARLHADRAAAPRVSLETLIDRVVTGSGYDRAVLAMPAGDRRMANVRKLMRMAREYEAREGRDLRGFIDFVAERDLIAEREGQAPLEAEQLDAVRLMTVHRAKGLEFPVVCVADLGKTGREDDSALRITDDGRVGLRLASIGGGAIDSAALTEIRARQKLEDEEEERRIFYVALTRAREHLVLSGATDLEALHEDAPLEEPMRWLWRALAPELPALGARAEARGVYEGRAVDVRCEVLRPAGVDELLAELDRDPVRPEPEPAGLEALQAPVLAAVGPARALPVSRISYSGLERYRRCGYRFYLERALGLRALDDERRARGGGGGDAAPARGEAPAEELPGVVRGSIVHSLLEGLDFVAPRAPDRAEVVALIGAHGEPVRDADVADLVALVDGFAAGALRARIAGAREVRPELPFAFTLDAGGRSLLVNGVVDVHAAEADRVLVVDYKSDRLADRSPAELVEEAYTTQRIVYALAALRAGAERVEVVYSFLERPSEPVTAEFVPADADALEHRLLDLAAGIVEGRFEPSPAPHRGLCGDCPGRPALCSWGPERTLAEEPG